MGLDMYLTARKYFEYEDYKTKNQGVVANDIKELLMMEGNKLDYVIFEIGYWRKANAIHKWFVDNTQFGKDECQEVYITENNIKKLLNVCEHIVNNVKLVDGKINVGTHYINGKEKEMFEDGKIIQDTTICEQLLPTQSGFFFGGTGYDEWYFEDIKNTIEYLKNALKLISKGWSIYYQASW